MHELNTAQNNPTSCCFSLPQQIQIISWSNLKFLLSPCLLKNFWWLPIIYNGCPQLHFPSDYHQWLSVTLVALWTHWYQQWLQEAGCVMLPSPLPPISTPSARTLSLAPSSPFLLASWPSRTWNQLSSAAVLSRHHLLNRLCTSCFKFYLFNHILSAHVLQSCLILWDPVDCSSLGSSVHGDSPGKNTGVGCHALLQGIILTQGSNLHLLRLLHWQVVLYH